MSTKSVRQGGPPTAETPPTSMAQASVTRITPPTKTTTTNSSSTTDRHFQVDKNIVDELLLVCSVIGSHDENSGKFVPVTDCLQWLQDLQRALRRDDDLFRPISLLVGDWRIVETKLVPLALACRYDTALLLTICKILVILTKPLATATQRAAVLAIDTKSAKAKKPEYKSVRTQQMKLRDNALKQAAQLLEYKRVLCQADGFFSVLVSLLAEPLAKTRREEEEHLCIEIVLHLLRNLLQAQPILAANNDDESYSRYHHQLIELLERELVLDVVCVLCADLEQAGSPNAGYNLLLMEILQHLVLPYKLEHVVAAHKDENKQASTREKSTGRDNGKTKTSSNSVVTSTGSLRGSLLRERQAALSMVSARHGNFGGSLVMGGPTDSKNKSTNWTVSTTQYAATALGRTNITTGSTTQGNRRVAVFVGALPSLHGSQTAPTPAARTACATLARFCHRFLLDCFAPWAKSIKNEFRRDSVRLEDGDRVVWLQLVAYWSKYWRATKPTKKHSSIGPLLFTMDVFSFHLVHNAADTFTQHKEYGKLAHAVSLLKEMMLLLQILYDSVDETEQIMAMGLLDRLFYGSEPLDRLPKLLSQWQPGQASHQYAADLVELVHTQIKMLERHAQACADLVDETGKRKKSKKNKKDTAHTDTITKMKIAAADFDVMSYIRKLSTAHNVYLYTQLLAQYAVNGTRLNHRLVTFLLRLCQFKIVVPEQSNQDDDEIPRNPIANNTKTVTLEPMLYNVRLLWVLHTILNDVAAVRDKALETVVQFAVRIVNRFAATAADNPMLLVEALVKHATPHRFCEALTNHYVTEELVMIAERDILLEEQEKWQAEENDSENEDNVVTADAPRPSFRRPRIADDSDDEGELEFDGGAVEAVTTPDQSKKMKSRQKKRKAILEDSDSEAEEDLEHEKSGNEESFPDKSNPEGDKVCEKAEPMGTNDVAIAAPTTIKPQRRAFADESDSEGYVAAATNEPGDKKRKSLIDDSDADKDGVGESNCNVENETRRTLASDICCSPSKKQHTAVVDDGDDTVTKDESGEAMDKFKDREVLFEHNDDPDLSATEDKLSDEDYILTDVASKTSGNNDRLVNQPADTGTTAGHSPSNEQDTSSGNDGMKSLAESDTI